MAEPVVGLIGCGHIGRFHSRNLRGSLRSELVPGQYVAVCDRELERASSFAAITGATTVTGAARDVFDRPGLNSVYICTETSEHPDLVVEAARRGLNVFCEKPLAKTLGEVQRMVDAVESAGVINQVGLVLRYSPVFTVLKEPAQPQAASLVRCACGAESVPRKNLGLPLVAASTSARRWASRFNTGRQ